ncbi:MAG TPA: hypothetical protein VN931_11930 [Fibrobacteria bacterium]|nr:hypothetical protein [Fibrobacteria bacterium]
MVNYANNSADLETGARLAGDAGVSLGLPGDPSHLSLSPAGLADVQQPEVVVHHGSLYQDLQLSQDEVYLAAPLTGGTLGLGLARIGADGILGVDRGQTPDFNNLSTFSATDWIGTLAFARTWMDGRLRGGASLRLLGSSIDNDLGAGAEMNASMVWAQDGWRAGLRMDHGLGGFSIWNTGTAEYSPPNLEAGFGWEHPFPYFYGTLALAWESPGLLQPEATSTFSTGDARPWVDPWLAARASRIAMEFHTDFGLVFRAGCEIQALVRITDFLQGTDQTGIYGESNGEFAVGAGYLWSDRVRIDYALVSTPDLGQSQRISLALVFGGKSAPKTVPPLPASPKPLDSAASTSAPVEASAPSDSGRIGVEVPAPQSAPLSSPAPTEPETSQPTPSTAPVPAVPTVVPANPAPGPEDDAPEQLSH